jgi:hypothetical protein
MPWRPLQRETEPSALAELYKGLGLRGRGATRLPPIYEQFILSYRWCDVDLGTYSLLPNLPAADLAPLLSSMLHYCGLRETLNPNGYFQFARGPDMSFDPICFDFRHRQRNGDCRIVQIDHEAILCDYRIVEVATIASSFRELVLQTIKRRRPETVVWFEEKFRYECSTPKDQGRHHAAISRRIRGIP